MTTICVYPAARSSTTRLSPTSPAPPVSTILSVFARERASEDRLRPFALNGDVDGSMEALARSNLAREGLSVALEGLPVALEGLPVALEGFIPSSERLLVSTEGSIGPADGLLARPPTLLM